MTTTLVVEEVTYPKGPSVFLYLNVNAKQIESVILDLKNEFENCKDHPCELQHYTQAEAGTVKTNEQVLKEMELDIDKFTNCVKDLVKVDPLKEALDEIQKEIYGEKYKTIDWRRFFKLIPRKKNGTFAIGRIVPISQAHGFSYEDMEAYGRKGPEIIIKTTSDTEAELIIRSSLIEKW